MAKSGLIELHAVTAQNWLQCIALETKAQQKGFVSSNLFSLAQSKVEPCRVPCAIYNQQGEMVGFAMYNNQPLADGSYRISRLMIDKTHQGQGYGRAAACALIERLKEVAGCTEIILDYVPTNEVAKNLWTALGFVVFDQDDGNLVARLTL